MKQASKSQRRAILSLEVQVEAHANLSRRVASRLFIIAHNIKDNFEPHASVDAAKHHIFFCKTSQFVSGCTRSDLLTLLHFLLRFACVG